MGSKVVSVLGLDRGKPGPVSRALRLTPHYEVLPIRQVMGCTPLRAVTAIARSARPVPPALARGPSGRPATGRLLSPGLYSAGPDQCDRLYQQGRHLRPAVSGRSRDPAHHRGRSEASGCAPTLVANSSTGLKGLSLHLLARRTGTDSFRLVRVCLSGGRVNLCRIDLLRFHSESRQRNMNRCQLRPQTALSM